MKYVFLKMINGWARYSLGELCALKSGYAFKSSTWQRVGIPVLQIGNIKPGIIHLAGMKYVDEDTAKTAVRFKMKIGRILISMTGNTTGSVARCRAAHEGFLINQRVGVIEDIDATKIIEDYLYWCLILISSRNGLMNMASGSAQPNLSPGDFARINVELPPILEQKRIAGVLGALDDLIEINRELARDCERLAIALADSILPTAPLSDFAEISDTDSRLPVEETDLYSLPAFDEEQLPSRVEGVEIKSNKIILREPVVLVSRLNPRIPRIWMVYPDQSVTSAASTEFVPLNGTAAKNEEVWALCNSQRFQLRFKSLVTGTSGSHQRVEKNAILSMLVPDISEMNTSSRGAFEILMRQSHASKLEARMLVSTRDQLLPLLMSGRISVKDVTA